MQRQAFATRDEALWLLKEVIRRRATAESRIGVPYDLIQGTEFADLAIRANISVEPR